MFGVFLNKNNYANFQNVGRSLNLGTVCQTLLVLKYSLLQNKDIETNNRVSI